MTLKKLLYWIMVKLLLLLVMMMMVVVLLMVMMIQVVVLVQGHPIITQSVLRGLRDGLQAASNTPLALHQLCNGRAVLGFVLQRLSGGGGTEQNSYNVSTLFTR